MPSCAAQGSRETGFELATIDAGTRWTLRTVSPVTVSSPIVRLGDVVQPLDPNVAGWQRLLRSPVGLVPLGGQTMTIERARLARAIQDTEATPRHIDWLGPDTIQVTLQAGQRQPSAVVQAAHLDASAAPATAAITATEAERLLYWIQLALERQLPAVAKAYKIELNPRQPELEGLRSIAGVTGIEPRGEVGPGRCRFHVVARSTAGPVDTDIELTLHAHPIVVVARQSLPRGHRLQAGDLASKPLPQDDFAPDLVVDAEAVIGLEVRGPVRANQPLRHGDLGAPTLIHRGDLIEVRVVGGGITVTTNAKAISSGGASDPIEVETLQPRRRLLARVVQPGLVEIVSRAPRVEQ